MSESLPFPPSPGAPAKAYLWALVLYLLTQAGLVLLKLLHLTAWPWGKVTALLWVPWAVLALLAALGWGLHLLGRGRG